MVTYNDLYVESDKITELTNILITLLGNRQICDLEITCELFRRYVDAVNKHLEVSDSDIYLQLLRSSDDRAHNMANKFMSGTREIKLIFKHYQKCRHDKKSNTLIIGNYEEFLKETTEMFDIVLDRLQDEAEHLYPFVRQLTGDSQKIA